MLEVLTVLAIIGILVAIAIPVFSGYRESALIKRCCIELVELELEISAYQLENGEFPPELTDMDPTPRLDPWGQTYRYLRIEGSNINGKGPLRKDKGDNPLNTDYDLYSIGKDGKTKLPFTAKDALDDVVRAHNGAYIGLADEH